MKSGDHVEQDRAGHDRQANAQALRRDLHGQRRARQVKAEERLGAPNELGDAHSSGQPQQQCQQAQDDPLHQKEEQHLTHGGPPTAKERHFAAAMLDRERRQESGKEQHQGHDREAKGQQQLVLHVDRPRVADQRPLGRDGHADGWHYAL